ncbi:Elongation of fatty acids protein 2 [Entophlyctis sp. JEL0112]|nr:Elongation of fatty acids protein 2 [Entophlyctis sp. JEL0112]
MGVRNLTALLKRYAPSAVAPVRSAAEAAKVLQPGGVVAVDALILARAFLHSFPSGTHPTESHTARVARRSMLLVRALRELDVCPVFCFDGPTRLSAKEREHQRRLTVFNRSVELRQLESERLDMLEELESTVSQFGVHRAEFGEFVVGEASAAVKLKEVIALNERLQANAKDLKICGESLRLHSKSSAVVQNLFSGESVLPTTEEVRVLVQEAIDRHLTLASRTLQMTPEILSGMKAVLSAMNVPVFTSPHEGEVLCAYLVSEGRAVATATEDMDACLFGDGIVLRKLYSLAPQSSSASASPFEGESDVSYDLANIGDAESDTEFDNEHRRLSNSSQKNLIWIDPVAARNQLGLTRAQFIDLGILCGTDFCATLKGVGWVTAYKLIKKHGSIEDVLKLGKYPVSPNFDYEVARNIFNTGLEDASKHVCLSDVDAAVDRWREGGRGESGDDQVEALLQEL